MSSRMATTKFLDISDKVLNYYMDSSKPVKAGYFVFSMPLSMEEIINLERYILSNPTVLKVVKVWAYNAKTLESVNGSPFPSIGKAAKYYHILDNRIVRHLDTDLATIHDGQWIYFFTKEISKEKRIALIKNMNKAGNVHQNVWVYKKLNGKYTLLDNNQPFKSKLKAAEALNISSPTVKKYLDTHSCFSEFYFFSSPQVQIP